MGQMKYLRRFIFLLFLPHFWFPWGRPWGNHAKCCMGGKRIRCLQIIVSQHVPIYLQQFPSYSNRKCKKSPFSRTAAHIFVSPGDAPVTITQYVAWMERQFNACQSSCNMYLSIFNSVVRLLMLFSEREWVTQYCPGEFTFYFIATRTLHSLLHNLARCYLQQRLSWTALSYFSDDITSS